MTLLRMTLLAGLALLAVAPSASARTLNDPCDRFDARGGVVSHPGGAMVCGPKLTIGGTQSLVQPLAPSGNGVVAAEQCPPGHSLHHPLMADGLYDYHDLVALSFATNHVQWDYWSAWAGWIYWAVANYRETSFSLGAGGPDSARIPLLNLWTETGTHVTRLILHCRAGASAPESFDRAADTSPEPDGPAVGDAGDDELRGGPGDDHVAGGPGDDELRGGAGRDVLDLGAGHDRVDAGNGRDMVVDAGGRDVIRLGPGHDTANVRDGARDRISCGAGEDAVVVDPVDRVDDDCEHVYPGATPAVPPVLGD